MTNLSVKYRKKKHKCISKFCMNNVSNNSNIEESVPISVEEK